MKKMDYTERMKKMDYTERLGIKEIVLNKIKFALQEELSPSVLKSLKLEEAKMTDLISESFVWRLTGFVLAEQINRTKTVEFKYKLTKNWWEMFKEQYFTKWLLNKFPVKYKEIDKVVYVDINDKFIYPKLPVEIPEYKDTLVIHHIDANIKAW
jgi:hypothetical protein